MVDYEASL
jgi:hypothetical protein